MERNATRTPDPSAFEQNQTIDRLTLFGQQVVLAVDHVSRRATQFSNERFAEWFAGDEREVLNHASDAVRLIGFVKDVAKLRKLAQQSQCRPHYFKHDGLLIGRHCDSSVPFDACKQSHLTKTGSWWKLTDLLRTGGVVHVNIELAFDSDVESVSSPFTLPH